MDQNKTSENFSSLSLRMRLERKGRGGKTVTIIEGFSKDDALEPLARDLRKALGCGSFVKDGSIIIQGDNRDRIALWFGSKGVKIKG